MSETPHKERKSQHGFPETHDDAIKLMEDAAGEMLGNYMTSERHHPNYVLVPASAFEKMRTALTYLLELEE